MVKSLRYIPDRGDLVWLDFSLQKGHEQAKKRPAIVLSAKPYNEKSGLMLVCPVTSRVKGYPFEVRLDAGEITGVVLSDQTRSVDWKARRTKFIRSVPSATLQETQEKIIMLLTEY